jgi:hypothetical protein
MAGSAGARPSTESREDRAFLALDARTSSDVWAAGWQARGNLIMPLVRHFDGTDRRRWGQRRGGGRERRLAADLEMDGDEVGDRVRSAFANSLEE